MAVLPTPERLGWAYARNILDDARRFPRQAATDFVLLAFVGLMLLGLLSQIVAETIIALGEFAQIFVNWLPIVAGMIALNAAPANAANVRRAAKGNWLETLPLDAATHAQWAVRRAGYFAIFISTLGALVLFDVTRIEQNAAKVSAANVVLMICVPVAAVLVRAAFQRTELLHPRETMECDMTRHRTTVKRRAVLLNFEKPLLRGLAGFVSAHTSSALMKTKLVLTLTASVMLMVLAMTEAQPQLLVLGAVLAPLMINSSLELPIGQVYTLGRSLPLSFRKLTLANVRITLLPALLFEIPFLICAPFVPEGMRWSLILLISIPGVAVFLFLRIAIEQAYPQSKVSRVLFSFAAAVAIGVFSTQAPLIAPFIGLLLGIAWLLERGWGIWEFGYGERAR